MLGPTSQQSHWLSDDVSSRRRKTKIMENANFELKSHFTSSSEEDLIYWKKGTVRTLVGLQKQS